VKLEELCLSKNPSLSDVTRTLIDQCLGLKSRRNSTSIGQPITYRVSSTDQKVEVKRTPKDAVQPVKIRNKDRTVTNTNHSKRSSSVRIRRQSQTIGFDQKKIIDKPVQVNDRHAQNRVDDIDIEELLPIAVEPKGIITPRPYWQRI
jgi:hypothetical protein